MFTVRTVNKRTRALSCIKIDGRFCHADRLGSPVGTAVDLLPVWTRKRWIRGSRSLTRCGDGQKLIKTRTSKGEFLWTQSVQRLVRLRPKRLLENPGRRRRGVHPWISVDPTRRGAGSDGSGQFGQNSGRGPLGDRVFRVGLSAGEFFENPSG